MALITEPKKKLAPHPASMKQSSTGFAQSTRRAKIKAFPKLRKLKTKRLEGAVRKFGLKPKSSQGPRALHLQNGLQVTPVRLYAGFPESRERNDQTSGPRIIQRSTILRREEPVETQYRRGEAKVTTKNLSKATWASIHRAPFVMFLRMKTSRPRILSKTPRSVTTHPASSVQPNSFADERHELQNRSVDPPEAVDIADDAFDVLDRRRGYEVASV